MEIPTLFEFPCPECGQGIVRTTRILNYTTKIKGYPFTVDEALIGVCEVCGAKSFAPEETDRWEALFAQSCEARRLFLPPQDITALRQTLQLSLEEFARLIGCTRQSLAAWEKPDRTTPPSRMVDLLMKLVRQSLHDERVDVLALLLQEANAWGLQIQVHRPSQAPPPRTTASKRTRRRTPSPASA